MIRRQCLGLALYLSLALTLPLSVRPVAADDRAAEFPAGMSWPAWATPGNADSAVEAVDRNKSDKWLRWVIPLPKRVRFEGKLVLPAERLSFRLRSDATDVEKTALDELIALISEKTGVKQFNGDFPILIGVCGKDGKLSGRTIPGAESLAGLKNANQAYVIAPLADRGIAVTALTDRGVFHGVKTLGQLLEPGLRRDRATLPLAAVLDWPDLAERGLWGGSANRDVQYLADRKYNRIDSHAKIGFDDQGRGRITIDAETQKLARRHAIKWVPMITHLELLSPTGIFERYPQVAGKGPKARKPDYPMGVAACFSEPKTIEVMAEWFQSLAATEGVDEVTVWLSEVEGIECGCPRCAEKGQYVLETEAAVRAWELARRKHPRVRLRILLTQGSYPSNRQVLEAAAPPEVGVFYYHGSLTYDSSRRPMIYPLLADYARRGRWLGCLPQLTASWRFVCPWSGPQFIKFRMTEFVDKGLTCLCGYATPDNRYYDFNVTAAAEWSWNAHGRDEREFAAAWATRRGLSDPEKAADWAVALGPVGWDVYGAQIPNRQMKGTDAAWIAARRPPGKQGMSLPLRQIDADLAACRKALRLAEELNEPSLIAETRVIQGYVRMAKAIHAIAETAAGNEKLDDPAKKSLHNHYKELVDAGNEVVANLQAWKDHVAPDDRAPRFQDTLDAARQTVEGVGLALAPLGIEVGGKY